MENPWNRSFGFVRDVEFEGASYPYREAFEGTMTGPGEIHGQWL